MSRDYLISLLDTIEFSYDDQHNLQLLDPVIQQHTQQLYDTQNTFNEKLNTFNTKTNELFNTLNNITKQSNDTKNYSIGLNIQINNIIQHRSKVCKQLEHDIQDENNKLNNLNNQYEQLIKIQNEQNMLIDKYNKL